MIEVGREAVSAGAFGRWLVAREGGRMARAFAEARAVVAEARRRGLEVGEGAVSQRLEWEVATRVEHAFLGRREDWLAELERTGRSEAGLRRQRSLEIEAELAAEALAADGRVVPEDKIVREWERRYGPGGRDYDLSAIHLVVELPSPPAGVSGGQVRRVRELERERVRRRALELRERIQAGEGFDDLARAFSDHQESRRRGGVLTGLRRAGWPAEFLSALGELEPGELSQPLYARGGWWIVRLRAVRVTPLETVREGIEAELVARGPEPDEIGRAWSEATRDLEVQLDPDLWSASAQTEAGGPAAMWIDGAPVPRREYASWLMASRGEASAPSFAEDLLVERRARELGIAVAPEAVEDRARAMLAERRAASQEKGPLAWEQLTGLAGRDEPAQLVELAARARMDLLAEGILAAERSRSGEGDPPNEASPAPAHPSRLEVQALRNRLLKVAGYRVLPAMFE